MADKQSRESIVETKVSDGVNESSIRVTSEGITLKVGVDVSDAITGLKAVQREAKKATQELKSMSASGFSIRANGDITFHNEGDTTDVFYTTKVLRNFTTEQLSEEISKRNGVSYVGIGSSEIQSSVITIDWREVTD